MRWAVEVRCGPALADVRRSSVGDGRMLIVVLLVALPRATHEHVADDVEAERDDEQQQAQEEQAEIGGLAALHLVGAGRQRRDGAVIVWPGPERVEGRSEPPVPPAAMATTIVSPIAREIPMMRAATMPDTAAGKTTRRLVVTLRAPRP